MPAQNALIEKISKAIAPEHIELVDESGGHSVPDGSASHWNLIVVSAAFEGKSLIERHRLVNAALADELRTGSVHALTMKTLTPAEWAAKGGVSNQSPPCLGGSKHSH